MGVGQHVLVLGECVVKICVTVQYRIPSHDRLNVSSQRGRFEGDVTAEPQPNKPQRRHPGPFLQGV
jgi:hypothetical protein